jgi:uncharacterized repeat protein (TIGR03803 family)
LYGTTYTGGTNDYGTVFDVATDGSGLSILDSFNGTDGASPQGGLLLVGSRLYGVTSGWAESGDVSEGSVFFVSIPEPSTFALLGIAAISLLTCAWRRRRKLNNLPSMILAAMVVLAAGSVQADVFNMGGTRDPMTGTWTGQASLEFVTVGDPGNAGEQGVLDSRYHGAVGYAYQMGKYDVTVGQYCQFLNAVAKTDTYGLYNWRMGEVLPTIAITQTGSSGSYSYAVTGSYTQAANCPIRVNWGDAARFCNWLQNGQPTRAEGNGTTETGSYTLNGATTDAALMAVTRNAGAKYVIPTENEWYKAAYYKGGGTNAGYWNYPTQSNTAPDNSLALAATEPNDANYRINGNFTDPTNYLTPVGTFSASPSPYGTYDMGGNTYQWNETALNGSRGLRGGYFDDYYLNLASSHYYFFSPTDEVDGIGFRVASVPEPGSIVLLLTGAVGLLAYVWRHRRS